ncbi:MAG: hypothetical protein V4726_16075 [Verrucomicrobiota bacterium]
MNLRDHLSEILPEILPSNPAESIKGTELIRLVKFRLQQEYSDATLRYHFSIMCCDPGSPIAKVEQGQGYYLRRAPAGGTPAGSATLAQARLGLLFETTPERVDRAVARALKFRAIYARDMEIAGRFPFVFESSFGPGAPYENVWKCPDAAIIDWETGEVTEQGLVLSPRLLEWKRSMGVMPFRISSVKLTVSITYDHFREDFFQAVSHAHWGHAGELVICAPIRDEQLAEDLRQLGTEYGIGITVYNLTEEALDDLPCGERIPEMSAREFEALQGRLLRQRLTSPRTRPLEWRKIEQVRQGNAEFQALFSWVQQCLHDGRAYPWRDFKAKPRLALAG